MQPQWPLEVFVLIRMKRLRGFYKKSDLKVHGIHGKSYLLKRWYIDAKLYNYPTFN